MKKKLSVVLVVGLVLTVAAGAAAEESRYLLVFHEKNDPGAAISQIEKAGGRVVRVLPEIGLAVAESGDPDFAAAAKKIKGVMEAGPAGYHLAPEVPVAVLDEVQGQDPSEAYFFPIQWDIRRVRAPQAWAEGVTGSHDTVVAILDTGIADNHPDLAANIVYENCFTREGSLADGVCTPYPDFDWHGTHVAGTVAAAGLFSAGVGPDLGLANYKIFEAWVHPANGETYYLAWTDARYAAMIDVVEQGFRVVNLSLGRMYVPGGRRSSDLAAARAMEKRVANYMKQNNVTVVAAAGNDGENTNGPRIHLPGDISGYVNVGATAIAPAPEYPYEGSYDYRAEYSNYGAALDLAAPGGEIPDPEVDPLGFLFGVFSTYVEIEPLCVETRSCLWGWAWSTGTSMAAPHVAGVAGLVIDNTPGLAANEVAAILKDTAENLGDRQQFGHGMVNAYAAIME